LNDPGPLANFNHAFTQTDAPCRTLFSPRPVSDTGEFL
jgi:hypothetical protein